MTLLRSLRAFALLACGAMALAGCHDIGFPINPDFSIALSPAVSTVTAAAPTTAYTFTVTPLQYFTRSVTVTLPAPQGFACVPASCTVTLPSYAAPQVFQLTPLAATPAGTYAFNFFATSGSLSHEVTAIVTISPAGPPTPDFTLSVSPLASTTVAGIAAPAYSLTETPSNGFAGTVAATPPAGFTCAPASCSVVLANGQAPNALQLTPAANTPAGSYTIPFTGTSGTVAHTADATLTVTAPIVPPPPPPPPANLPCAAAPAIIPPANANTGLIYTGDPSSAGLIYDAARNRILVANLQLNEIDVLSPESLTITGRLPVPQPMGLDLSADGKTLVIGTRTHYFYRATADTLCITDRHYLPLTPPIGYNVSPMFPTALSDASILFIAYDPKSTASDTFLWTEASGFTRPFPGFPTYSIGSLLRSGDHQHAFLSGAGFPNVDARYDVGGGFVVKSVSDNVATSILAVNQDGSRILTGAGISIFIYPADPLSVATATVASGQLTLLGSGFDKASTLTIDTLPTPVVFDNSTQLTATLPPLPSGVHSVTLTAPNQPAYTLSLAFTTP